LTTRADPSMPPAPATFSTTICWPSTSPSRRAMIRPSKSVPPPGANGTTIVTGRSGQFWAAAGLTPLTKAVNARSTRRMVGLMVRSFIGPAR
jgi:hypothetical protein